MSLAKVFAKDICEATPSTYDECKRLPLESATTLRLHRPMPHGNSIRLLRIYKGALSDPVEIALKFARLDEECQPTKRYPTCGNQVFEYPRPFINQLNRQSRSPGTSTMHSKGSEKLTKTV